MFHKNKNYLNGSIIWKKESGICLKLTKESFLFLSSFFSENLFSFVSFAVIFKGEEQFCCYVLNKWLFESVGSVDYLCMHYVYLFGMSISRARQFLFFSTRENDGGEVLEMSTHNFLGLWSSLYFSESLPSLILTLSLIFFSLFLPFSLSAYIHTHTHTKEHYARGAMKTSILRRVCPNGLSQVCVG